MNRYITKAQILGRAWMELFGTVPRRIALVNAMSVAELETRMGDAWPGEHNWGAVMKRALSSSEKATLQAAGITASGGPDALVRARQVLTPGPNEALHGDTSPASGPYFAWFWSFPTPEAAAKKFLEVLVGARPKVRAIIDAATPEALARAMYETRYYEGHHKADPEANIRDYAAAISHARQAIERGLASGSAPPSSEPSAPSSSPVSGVGFGLAAVGVLVGCIAIAWSKP